MPEHILSLVLLIVEQAEESAGRLWVRYCRKSEAQTKVHVVTWFEFRPSQFATICHRSVTLNPGC